MAVFSVSLTCIVISVDDGLLRTSTGCAGPSPSLILYVDWLKVMIIAKRKLWVINTNFCNSCNGLTTLITLKLSPARLVQINYK